jgi:hypothetical protein
MRVMAGNALSSFERRMDVLLAQADLLFTVAGVTGFISVFFQNELRHQTVPKVTLLAFFFLDNLMNIFHPHVFVGKLLMAVEAIFLCKSPSLGRLSSKRLSF